MVREECVNFGNELLKIRQKQRTEEDLNRNLLTDEEEAKKPQIFVDLMLAMTEEGRKQFTEIEIRDHVFTFVSAGTETTALAISYVLLFLAIHPEVQEKVVAELKEVIPSPDVQIDYDLIKKLTYMDMVLKETLRLCPSVPTMARQTLDEIELDGHKIPKGVDIIVNIFALHRRKENWGEDAHLFNPDRFLPEYVEKRHSYCYIPFSTGVRNCIGQKYAMISLKVMLINFLRSYKFKTKLTWSDVKWKFDIHLHITRKHLVAIERRNFYDN